MTPAQREQLHSLCQAYRTEPKGPCCEYASVSDRYAAIERFVVQVEQETLIDAIEAAIHHTSPVIGEECSGCEVVEQIRKLAMKAGEGVDGKT